MYSFRISFCSVPRSAVQGMPRFSATARYMASSAAAGALMVMDVLIRSSGIPEKRVSMSSSVSTATPQTPTSPSADG